MEEKLNYPALSISTKNNRSYTGILVRGKPALSSIQGVELANPVILNHGLVYTTFSATTKQELVKQVAGVKLDSISFAYCGNQVALIASGEEKPASELFRALKF